MGAKPFEIQTNLVPEKVVLDLMRKDGRLMTSLLAAGWPTDEKTCERIAGERGLGAESVAAVSKYQRALLAERADIDKLN